MVIYLAFKKFGVIKMSNINHKRIVEYLESRILINNHLLKMEDISTITFSEFIKKYNAIVKLLEEQFDLELEKQRLNLEMNLIETVKFTETEIATLMSFIKKSLQCSKDNKMYYQTEKEFVYRVLENLSEIEESKELDEYKTFFEIKRLHGLTGVYTGKISLDNDRCMIKNSDDKLIYHSDMDGKVFVNIPLEEEELLISTNLFYGILYKQGKQIKTIFLKKDNGMLAIDCDYEIYTTNEEDGNYVEIISSFNDYMRKNGYNHFVKRIYDKMSFNRIVGCFTDVIRLEEQKLNVKRRRGIY